jgi:hypothetical protein
MKKGARDLGWGAEGLGCRAGEHGGGDGFGRRFRYFGFFRMAEAGAGAVGVFRMESMGLEEASKFFHIHLSIPDQLSEKTWLQGGMVRHRERFSGRIEWMPKANVATALADDFVTKTLKGPNSNLA